MDAAGKIPATLNAATKGNVDAALASAAHTVSGTFEHHYQGHMPIGPSCCRRGRAGATSATIWSNTQNVENLVTDLTNVLSPLTANQIRVLFYEGSGLVRQRLRRVRHGRVGGDHVEGDRQAGAPADDALGRARLDALRPGDHVRHAGRRRRERQHRRLRGHRLRPGRHVALHLAASSLGAGPGAPTPTANALPTKVGGGGAMTENLSPWMKVSNDELPGDQQADPTRRRHLPQRRAPRPGRTADDVRRRSDHGHAGGRGEHGLARVPAPEHEHRPRRASAGPAVLQAAATAAGWKPWVSGSNAAARTTSSRAAASPTATTAAPTRPSVADITVNKKTGKITVTHVYAAQDSGFSMNPSLIYNQMMGNVIQGIEPRAVRGGHVQQEPGDLDRLGRRTRSSASRTRRRSRTSSSSGPTSRRSARASRRRARSSVRSRTRSTTRPASACTRLRSRRRAFARRSRQPPQASRSFRARSPNQAEVWGSLRAPPTLAVTFGGGPVG